MIVDRAATVGGGGNGTALRSGELDQPFSQLQWINRACCPHSRVQRWPASSIDIRRLGSFSRTIRDEVPKRLFKIHHSFWVSRQGLGLSRRWVAGPGGRGWILWANW